MEEKIKEKLEEIRNKEKQEPKKKKKLSVGKLEAFYNTLSKKGNIK